MSLQNVICILLVEGVVGAVLFASPQSAGAQATTMPAFTSRPILTSPVSGDDSKQLVLMAVSIQPGASVPVHTHPGDCIGSVIDGTVELFVHGKESRRLAPGDSYANLRGTIHWFRNVGDQPAKLLNTLVVDKGAPAVQPATLSQK
jgi:quercetin dioxygenase-like cupin family protein